MAAESQFIAWAKIKSRQKLLAALGHNLRELPKDKAHIDYTKSHNNIVLAGEKTAAGIDREYRQHLKTLKNKPRSNAVLAVEFLFSLPVLRHGDNKNGAFFEDCKKWLETDFGGEILSFVVHLDEAAPHAHALVMPLRGGKLNGSDMVGGLDAHYRRLESFHENVGKKHGLTYTKKLTAAQMQALEIYSLNELRAVNDPVLKSRVWHVVRNFIKENPKRFADALAKLDTKPTLKDKNTDGISVGYLTQISMAELGLH